MTALNLTDFQADWIDAPDWTAHDRIGFELGWDYAHYRVDLPQPYAQSASPLRQGVLAAESTFGPRTLTATAAVRLWLQLRLHAWLRGRSVELFQVTPNYLQQIVPGHCPILRRRSFRLTTLAACAIFPPRADGGERPIHARPIPSRDSLG